MAMSRMFDKFKRKDKREPLLQSQSSMPDRESEIERSSKGSSSALARSPGVDRSSQGNISDPLGKDGHALGLGLSPPDAVERRMSEPPNANGEGGLLSPGAADSVTHSASMGAASESDPGLSSSFRGMDQKSPRARAPPQLSSTEAAETQSTPRSAQLGSPLGATASGSGSVGGMKKRKQKLTIMTKEDSVGQLIQPMGVMVVMGTGLDGSSIQSANTASATPGSLSDVQQNIRPDKKTLVMDAPVNSPSRRLPGPPKKNSRPVSGKESLNLEDIFRNDGTFHRNGFQISQEGILARPDIGEQRRSRGSSLDGVPRSAHKILEIRDFTEMVAVKTIGQGASGRVYLASHSPSGMPLAVKVVNVADEDKQTQLMKELETLTTYVSRFLVRFYGAFYDPSKRNVHLALEYMDSGALCDVIADFGPIPESVTNHIAFHCLQGLKFLHDSHVLHRDFKTANILLSKQSARAKLSDFGLARDVAAGISQANTFVGTVAYMSPERLHGSNYTYASDIWGLGVSLAECLLGRYPFEKPHSYFDYIEATMTENLLPHGRFSKDCESFILMCANVDPKKRPRTEALLKHPWIVNTHRDPEEFCGWLDHIQLEKERRT
ncbi:Mitogen-activated protein kinase kinase 6 [Porphyridium purpureum]|uniref:mitogen-activated protein kinase kinase n=1 Tax=Porphyridium purpureum TaxID=35688 RepID=A0A5J4YIV9_PORPP|nr:Mitogen-activated protein kinase kinase 6 [Porphyridium purpureum]|eukprot:POR5134..scf261_15